jgi:uncharacterized membrane protein
MNKKIIAQLLATITLVFIFIAIPVLAATPNGSTGPGDSMIFKNPIKATSLQDFLKSLLRVVTMLGAIVVVFFIIFAGFNYVTARGDEKKIQAATKTLTWTAVGAAVILGAQVIATAIQGTVNELGSGN